MADNVASTMARRLAAMLRAQNPWGVANQELRMAMNAAEHPVAELNLADRSAAMSESSRMSQSVPLREVAQLCRLMMARRMSRELALANRAPRDVLVLQAAPLLPGSCRRRVQLQVVPRARDQRALKLEPRVSQPPRRDSQELRNLAHRARLLSRRASSPPWSWPLSRLPLLLRRRPSRGNAYAHVRRGRGRSNSSASSFR
jgi:hypothetical protein